MAIPFEDSSLLGFCVVQSVTFVQTTVSLMLSSWAGLLKTADLPTLCCCTACPSVVLTAHISLRSAVVPLVPLLFLQPTSPYALLSYRLSLCCSYSPHLPTLCCRTPCPSVVLTAHIFLRSAVVPLVPLLFLQPTSQSYRNAGTASTYFIVI